MISLRDPQQLFIHQDSVISTIVLLCLSPLLQQRFMDMADGAAYDPVAHGYLLLVEPGDSVEALETACKCPILGDWCSSSRYGDEAYSPAYDWLDEHPFSYEIGFVIGNGGYGVLIVVPKLSGIHPDLLRFCRQYASLNLSI